MSDEIERIRARDEATPRDLVTAGYGQVHEDRRTLLAALDASQREAERLRGERDQLRGELAAEPRSYRGETDDETTRAMMMRAVALARFAGYDDARNADFMIGVLRGAIPDALRTERDQARRAALEEAIAECQRVLDASPGDDAGIVVAVKRLRALLDAPATVRPDPATCPHERVMGGTCSDCAAPVAVNGHEPGCHASGLGPPRAMGAGGWTGCGCTPRT